MIKAFLFDYDGVMTAGVNVSSPSVRLAQNLGIDTELAEQYIGAIWAYYSTGEMTSEDMWKAIEAMHGQAISDAQRDIWFTWQDLTPLPEMTKLVAQIRSKGYPVGLLSNVFPPTAELIRSNGGYEGFDFLVLSCEAGTRKPEAAIYQTALEHLPDILPEEVLFLDDREACIIGARDFGMETIHVTDHSAAIRTVQELIV